jgi:hypothetical protein
MCRPYRSAVQACEKGAQGAIPVSIIASHPQENLLIIVSAVGAAGVRATATNARIKRNQ